jgi:hypothetical protein
MIAIFFIDFTVSHFCQGAFALFVSTQAASLAVVLAQLAQLVPVV